MIHHRPAEVNDRKTGGHWQGDLIIGQGQGSAIGTLVERTTRYVQLIYLPDGWKAPQVRNAIATQTAHLPAQLRKTLTWDQGRELTLHEELEAFTGIRIYFGEPHSPWQRGTNENTNSLLRQSTFPRASTSPATPPEISDQSPGISTTAPASSSQTTPQHRPCETASNGQ